MQKDHHLAKMSRSHNSVVHKQFTTKVADAVRERDWDAAQREFYRFGHYLELMDHQHTGGPSDIVAVSVPHRPLMVMEVR